MIRCLFLLALFISVSCSGQPRPEQETSAQKKRNETENAPSSIQAQLSTEQEKRKNEQQSPKCPLPPWTDPFWPSWAMVAVTLAAVWIAFGTLADLKEQTSTARIAADAAKKSADAVINSERAWMFADLKAASGMNMAVSNSQTHIYIRVECNNVGRSPAWIIEVRVKFMFIEADKLPPIPGLDDAEQVWAGTRPMAPNDEPFSTGEIMLTADGIQVIDSTTRKLAVVYGVVRYRDIFADNLSTTFGYRILPGENMRFGRLVEYPEYNKNT